MKLFRAALLWFGFSTLRVFGWMVCLWSVVDLNASGLGAKAICRSPTIFTSTTEAININFASYCFSNKLHDLCGDIEGFMQFRSSVKAPCTTSTSWPWHFSLWIACFFSSLFFFFIHAAIYWHILLIRCWCFPLASVKTSFYVRFWTWWGQFEIKAHKIKVGSKSVLLFVVQPQSELRRE